MERTGREMEAELGHIPGRVEYIILCMDQIKIGLPRLAAFWGKPQGIMATWQDVKIDGRSHSKTKALLGATMAARAASEDAMHVSVH